MSDKQDQNKFLWVTKNVTAEDRTNENKKPFYLSGDLEPLRTIVLIFSALLLIYVLTTFELVKIKILSTNPPSLCIKQE